MTCSVSYMCHRIPIWNISFYKTLHGSPLNLFYLHHHLLPTHQVSGCDQQMFLNVKYWSLVQSYDRFSKTFNVFIFLIVPRWLILPSSYHGVIILIVLFFFQFEDQRIGKFSNNIVFRNYSMICNWCYYKISICQFRGMVIDVKNQ